MNQEKLGYIEVVLSQALVGIMYIIVRLGSNLGAYNLSFFRVFLAALFTGFLFVSFKKYKLALVKHERKKLLAFGIMHGLLILANFASVYFLSLAMVALFGSMCSIWMIIFSSFLLKERISRKTMGAILLAFLGLILMLWSSKMFVGNQLIGILLGLFVAIGGGWVYAISKTFKSYDKVSLTFWQNLIATPLLLPLVFIKLPTFGTYNVFLLIGLGIVGAFSFILMYKGFGLIKGQNAGVLVLLEVVFTVLFAFVFFKEIPSLREMIGGILIMAGCYLTSK